jgi:hypothetical protein
MKPLQLGNVPQLQVRLTAGTLVLCLALVPCLATHASHGSEGPTKALQLGDVPQLQVRLTHMSC